LVAAVDLVERTGKPITKPLEKIGSSSAGKECLILIGISEISSVGEVCDPHGIAAAGYAT
jgi:hypothetical protein